MPRNGVGTYVLPAGQPVVPNTTISSAVFNTFTNDVATALTNSIAVDGQTPMAANLPMGNNKITGLAAGSVATDAARMDQVTVKADLTALAASSGSSLVGFTQSLSGAVARTVQSKLRDVISIKDFGAVGNGIADDTTALNAALAAMTSGVSLYFPSGNYKVTSQIVFPSGQMSYFGDGPGQSLITYVGADTTNDCFVFGNGTNDVNQLLLSGIQFRSNTLMTGGAGVRFKRLTRSRINDCTFGHQDGNGNFYHGVWFDAADFVTLSGFQARAQQDGMRVNGGTGGRADLFLNNGKISSSMVGLHIGGDFGGLYLETVDIINNATNVLIDRTITNVANRETFFGPGCLIDTADTTRTATTYDGICLDVQDTDGFIIMTGTWVATCGTAIRLGASFAGTFEFAGGIIFNCFTTYGGAGNAIEIGSTNANVVVNGTIFKNVQAKGIYCSGGTSTNVILRSPVFQSDVVTPLDTSIDAKIDTKSIGYNTTSFYSYGKSAFGARAPIQSATDGSPAHTFAMGPSGWGGSVHMAYYGAVASGPFLNLSKSRGTTIAAHAAVVVNDALGAINFEGSDGTNYQSAGRITTVAGSVSGTIVPGEMQFFTKDTGGTLTRSAVIQTDHHFRPGADNAYTCGASGFRWSAIWSANGTIQTSDARTKLDISDSALGLDFINSLRPVSYRWKEGGKTVIGQEWFDRDGNPCDENTEGAIPGDVITVSKEGDRIHWGFIAQEVKSAADAADVDFGGWVLSDKNDPDSQQALRYDQFISPLVKAVQELSAKVAELELKLQ